MRFVLATISHETNTFSPIPTPLASFAIGRPAGMPIAGDEIAQLAVELLRQERHLVVALILDSTAYVGNPGSRGQTQGPSLAVRVQRAGGNTFLVREHGCGGCRR